MKPDVDAPCRLCGQPTIGSGVGGACPYCLLQLGLGSSAAPAGLSSVSRSSANSSGDEFVRQGVLPKFGDYELESEIARGGMGVVYRARQRSLNRVVAVKMILAGQLASPESIQRFRLEAEAAARLHHPGIVQIYEIGEHETQHFFSMELIEGVSLAECLHDFQLVKKASPSVQREQELCIAELLVRVARALEFAHQRGVLHRDLKPSNILIDEQGQPHLTDFGLAKLTGRESSGLTLSAAVLGTPGYLAPEQAAGLTEQVTTAADVYGLGATLYELLTGQPPFVGTSAVQTMWMAIHEEAVHPRQLNSTVHRDLETIALRCLEKNPERRYPSSAAVADELERFIRHEPIQARPVSRLEHGWRWCQRNPGLAGLASTLLLAILIGSGTAFWQWGRAQSANVRLTENVGHLEWAAIDTMLESGQSSRALAKVASLLRTDPGDRNAAMFAMSVLEQRRFPVPAAPPIRHPNGGELSVARISPTGNRVVTAAFDRTARLWDPATSESTAPPCVHEAAVTWAAFSPDGSLLATCSEDKTVRLWDPATGHAVGQPYRFEEGVARVEFSPDGRHLLARTRRQVAMLDGRDARLLIGPIQHAGNVLTARFVSNGTAFFTAQQAGEDSGVQVWNVHTGQEQASMKTGPLRAADLSEDLSQIVTADGKGNVAVSKFPSGEGRNQIIREHGAFSKVGFNRSGDLIYTVHHNHWARVWSARTALPVTGELSHYYLIEGADFLDGNRLLTWGSDSLTQIWDIETSQPYCEPIRHTNRQVYSEVGKAADSEIFLTTVSHLKSRTELTQTGMAQVWRVQDRHESTSHLLGTDPGYHDSGLFSDDGRLVAIANTKPEIWVFDTATGKPYCGPLQINGLAWGLMLSSDSKRLIAVTSRGQVSIFSIPDGKLVGPPSELSTTIQPSEITLDGNFFATGSIDGKVRFWNAITGQLIHEMVHGSEINSVAFSPDGGLLASAGEDRVIRVWHTGTGKLARELKGHKNEVMSIAFSPDGRQIASASLDFSGRIWDANSGQELSILPHQGEVIDTVFSPDGRLVGTASRDRTAVIWDAHTGMPRSRSLMHNQGVRNLRFSRDGQQLLTLDFRGPRLWDVATGHPLTVQLPHEIMGGTGFQHSSGRADLTPDGRTILVVCDCAEARLWKISIPPKGAPAWFPELLEAVAGQRFAEGAELPEAVPPDRFLLLERQLRDSRETDYYTQWAHRWLFDAK